jgi:DNA-binding NtrC family response regulator
MFSFKFWTKAKDRNVESKPSEPQTRVLLIGTIEFRDLIQKSFRKRGDYTFEYDPEVNHAIDEMKARGLPNLVILEIIGSSDYNRLYQVHSFRPRLPVIVVTDTTRLQERISLLRSGAFDYIDRGQWGPNLAMVLAYRVDMAIQLDKEWKKRIIEIEVEGVRDALKGIIIKT